MTTREEAELALRALYTQLNSFDPTLWSGGEDSDLVESERLRNVVRSRLAELESKVPRWVPVTERLPPEKNDALQVVLIQEGYPTEPIVVPAYFGMGHFFHYTNDVQVDWRKPIGDPWVVTHWMPLAKLPRPEGE